MTSRLKPSDAVTFINAQIQFAESEISASATVVSIMLREFRENGDDVVRGLSRSGKELDVLAFVVPSEDNSEGTAVSSLPLQTDLTDDFWLEWIDAEYARADAWLAKSRLTDAQWLKWIEAEYASADARIKVSKRAAIEAHAMGSPCIHRVQGRLPTRSTWRLHGNSLKPI